MAITRAQIARELYIKGGVVNPDGRRGFAGGAGMGASDRGYQGGGRDTKGSVSGSAPGAGSSSHTSNTPSGADDRSSALQTYNTKVATGRLSDEDYETVEDVPLNKREETEKENKDLFINKEANYSKYTPSYVKFLGDLNRNPNRKFFYERVLKNNAAGLNYTQLEDEYDKYMSNRLAGYTDAMGNTDPNYRKEGDQYFQIDSGRGGDNIISPIIPEDDTTEEDEVNPRDYTGLAPRIMGSIFDFTGLAEGGRVAAQQGGIMSQQGGIMPRLNDLGTDVSSAEQMLQEINQRLQSAESTLGEGGGDPASGLIAIQPNNFNNFQPTQMPIGQPTQTTPFDGRSLAMRNAIGTLTPPSYSGGRLVPDLRTAGLEQLANNVAQGMEGFAPQPGGPIQSPLQSSIRQGAMDGGRMRQIEMMQDEDDPTGGIMDLESGRQMYFLGKLVKKAGRAIKKVAKSPIGKAALLYGLGSLGAGFVGKAQAGTGTGFFSNLFKSGKGKNLLSGIFDYAKDNPYKSIFGLSTLAGLSGESKDEDKPIDIGEGINIDRFRYAPYRTLAPSIVGSNYQTGTEGRKDGGRMGYQEGGDAEPVAKKTMPLLDMDGMEKDYREDGGFVPIGRMERADDVPARLSKNEFVFTADAVRNAGDGDIDKGAEVMYNMMKNLESGGEVSEESQGLDGAREMFQTSKRLEEVL
jgi:hypothetical protein